MDGPNRDFAGARVTVMGLGLFGGGAGVVEWLAARGADVLATDLAKAEALAPTLARLRPLVDRGAVRLRLGEHNVSDFTDCDLVVANPAVPYPSKNRFLRAAGAAGVPVTTEIRLVVERLPRRERVIGVTGSAGKSTTSAMIAHALRAVVAGEGQALTRPAAAGHPLPRGERVRKDDRAAPSVHLGGNIGGSLLEEVGSIGADDFVVLELSSFMLHWLGAGEGWPGAPSWAPGVAVVTNIAPNHLDWHGSMEHYERSKRRMIADQGAGDVAVLGAGVASWKSTAGGACTVVGAEHRALIEGVRLLTPGAHNRENAAVALAAAGAALARSGLPRDDETMSAAARSLGTFRPLPHRLQLIARWRRAPGARPVAAYHDSKSTTPEAAARAIDALLEEGCAGVRLICGGYDKGADLAPMFSAAARCAGTHTIGKTGPKITAALRARGTAVEECGELFRAVRTAVNAAGDGEAVLLSPGCASWDQFTNFEERGAEFCRIVVEVAGALGFRIEDRASGSAGSPQREKNPNDT